MRKAGCESPLQVERQKTINPSGNSCGKGDGIKIKKPKITSIPSFAEELPHLIFIFLLDQGLLVLLLLLLLLLLSTASGITSL